MKGEPGFYKRRRGILEHLEAGRINLVDLAVHDYLNLKANLLIGGNSSIPPGVCITSAVAIHAVCPGQISEKAIQRSLKHLEQIRWIKRWNVPGKHGNYPVLVCRASVHDLSGKEYRINGEETTDWRYPKWELVGDSSASGQIAVPLLSTDREKRAESRERKPAAKTTRPADPRFQPFYSYAYESFRAKHRDIPLWREKDRGALNTLLRSLSPEALPQERLQALWENYLASTEAFIEKQGDGLAYFCGNLDKFANGPILAAIKGGSNGKLTGEALTRANLRAAGFDA